MENQWGQQIRIRQCSKPTQAVTAIYNNLGYKPKPFGRKKSVVSQSALKKNEAQQNQYIRSG